MSTDTRNFLNGLFDHWPITIFLPAIILMLVGFIVVTIVWDRHDEGVAEETTPQPATPRAATPEPATPQPASSQPATSQPATSQPATPQPATARPATAQPYAADDPQARTEALPTSSARRGRP